ncbi:MAG: Rpn family recombination-promoting nuclease/putative transposase [Erysipelotrichaceae bacterium]|nr:Rpn family recombination-promoting nuclease/putative transposase [Erysipelotrichaceae bacterium]
MPIEINNRRKYEENYPFTNDLMFCYVLSNNPDLAKELIELILDLKIDHVEIAESQKTLNYSIDSRSVRFDVYMKNDTDVFDVEMQTGDTYDLPKRMRYYQAAITCDDLSRGDSYSRLRNSYVIFICTKDPFGTGNAIYRFRMMEEDDMAIEYDDGAYDVVINCAGHDPSMSQELQNLLSYLREGSPVDNFTHRIQNEVEQFNQDPSFRRTAMTLYEKIRDASREGLQKGLQKGDYNRILQSVKSLIANNYVESEEEACKALNYDFNEYLAAKNFITESDI